MIPKSKTITMLLGVLSACSAIVATSGSADAAYGYNSVPARFGMAGYGTEAACFRPDQTYFYGVRVVGSKGCSVGYKYLEIPMQVAPGSNADVYGYATFTRPSGRTVYARMVDVSDDGWHWGASPAKTGKGDPQNGDLVQLQLGYFGPIGYRHSVIGQFYTYVPSGTVDTPVRLLSFTVANNQ
jgi:hypothetical protein